MARTRNEMQQRSSNQDSTGLETGREKAAGLLPEEVDW